MTATYSDDDYFGGVGDIGFYETDDEDRFEFEFLLWLMLEGRFYETHEPYYG